MLISSFSFRRHATIQNMHKEALVSKTVLCQYFTTKCVRILRNTAVHWLNLTPKRNVVRSSRAGGATSEQKSALLRRLFMLWAKTSPARSLAPPFQLLSAPMRLQAGRPPCVWHFSPLRSIDFNRPIQNDRCKPSNNGLQRFCYHF